MNSRNMLICLVGALMAGTALADGVAVNPGRWEMTMTMEMSLMPAPQTRSFTKCIEEKELGPDSFNMDENSPCDFSGVAIDGDSVSWSINCPSPAGAMVGHWEFTSSGDSVVGSGSMSADIVGQSMEFTMNWEGERVGDCE